MNFVALSNIFSPELATIIIAMLPITELRGSIPIAISVYKLDPLLAYCLSVVGSIIPAFFILEILGPLSGYLIERFAWAKVFFSWLFANTKNKFSHKYTKWGGLALVIFVAIPLPATGVWSGAVAAFLFGIPKKLSLALLFIGSAIAGLIVTLATLGIISLF